MKTWLWPNPIRRKTRTETVYIRDKDGTLTWNCTPERATERRKIQVTKIWSWPVTFFLETYDKEDQLLCVLAGGHWVYQPHRIFIFWRGILGGNCGPKHVFKLTLPQRWWSWRVLAKSKKLFWHGKKMWGRQ